MRIYIYVHTFPALKATLYNSRIATSQRTQPVNWWKWNLETESSKKHVNDVNESHNHQRCHASRCCAVTVTCDVLVLVCFMFCVCVVLVANTKNRTLNGLEQVCVKIWNKLMILEWNVGK